MLKRFIVVISLILLPVFSFATTITHTSDTDFSSGTLTNIITSGFGATANLQLSTTATITYGPKFFVDGNTYYSMTSTNHRYSMRFTAQQTRTITKVWVYNSGLGTMPTYKCEIQSDDTTGKPSGGVLGTATFTPQYMNRWQIITLTSSVPITAGIVYHIVISYSSGTINGSNYLSIVGVTPPNLSTPFSDTTDSSSNLLYSSTATIAWILWDYQPVYLLEDSSGNVEGNPYSSYSDLSVYGSGVYRGEKFTITGNNKSVNGVRFHLKCSLPTPPADHLYVVLENVTDGIEMESGKVVDTSQITNDFTWYYYIFTSPKTLQVGKTYRIYLRSPSSASTSYYLVRYFLSSNTYNNGTSGGATITTSNSITYDGINSIYSTWNGSSWVDYNNYDLMFKFSNVAYTSSGTFESSVIDCSSASEFKTILWEPTTQASNTTVKFQIASSNSSDGTWEFLGYDGTKTTYYTQSGQTISGVHSGKRYIKYKTYFETTDANYSPSIDKVTIEYNTRTLTGKTLEAQSYPNPFSPGTQSTTIKYILNVDSNVTIRIYDAAGDLVKEMNFSAGSEGGKGNTAGYDNKITWDGRNGYGMIVANGGYICQIIAEPTDGSGVKKEIRKIGIIK